MPMEDQEKESWQQSQANFMIMDQEERSCLESYNVHESELKKKKRSLQGKEISIKIRYLEQ
jgi:hypothetical protein